MISGGCTQLTLFYNMLHCQILPPPPKVYSWHFPSNSSWGVGSLMRKAFPEVKLFFIELRAVLEFFLMETTYTVGINLQCCCFDSPT